MATTLTLGARAVGAQGPLTAMAASASPLTNRDRSIGHKWIETRFMDRNVSYEFNVFDVFPIIALVHIIHLNSSSNIN